MNIITRNNREFEILHDAIEAFKKETGVEIEHLFTEPIVGMFGDAMLRIGDRITGTEYNVEIKTTLNDVTIGRLAHAMENFRRHNLVVTRNVTPQQAKKMKDLNIQFMDTAGNAYINNPPLLIYVYGNRTTQPGNFDVEQNIFGLGGIRILFVLLCEPELQDAPYREIANAAGVALGTVAGVMKNLLQQGYIMDVEGKRKTLLRKKELLDKWTNVYATKLRPKRLIGRYTTQREYLWRDVDIRDENAFWGGEVAANKLTNYLKPEILTIYTRRPIDDLVLNLRLRKDENGVVELREQFWQLKVGAIKKETVPPLLIYADLLATGDNRNIETAKIIYDEHLKRYLE